MRFLSVVLVTIGWQLLTVVLLAFVTMYSWNSLFVGDSSIIGHPLPELDLNHAVLLNLFTYIFRGFGSSKS